jgi:NADH:ubiquinone oxidoreductase subunit E
MTRKKSARSNIRARDENGPNRPPRAVRSTRKPLKRLLFLLGDRPRRRDLLIEHLHLIQDTWKQISATHLAALADEMKLSFAEVFEDRDLLCAFRTW